MPGRGVRHPPQQSNAPPILRASPALRRLVAGARALRPGASDLTIIDRCNLTVLLEPGQEDLASFLAAHKVRVVASLPCYSQSNVDGQRGAGVFDRSIRGLKLLNSAGYGVEGSGLALDLVYNPGGAFLAPPREKLEPAYKQELLEVGASAAEGVSLGAGGWEHEVPQSRRPGVAHRTRASLEAPPA